MSTFMGLLSAGRPSPSLIILEGLGAPPAASKKGKKKAKRAGSVKTTTTTKVVRVKGGLRNQPIDDYKHPFKRSARRGPTDIPNRRHLTTDQTDEWTCERATPTATHTIQRCVSSAVTRSGKPRVKLIKVGKAYKKKYNKEYREYLKRLGKPKFANSKSNFYEYRKTAWAAGRTPAVKKPRAKKKAAKK